MGVRLRPNRLQNGPLGESVKQDDSQNLNNSRNFNAVRLATKEGTDRDDAELTKQVNRILTLIDKERTRIDQI